MINEQKERRKEYMKNYVQNMSHEQKERRQQYSKYYYKITSQMLISEMKDDLKRNMENYKQRCVISVKC